MSTLPRALQHEAEFAALLALYRMRRPERVLEIGVGEGGTLYHWLQGGPELVVALDLYHVDEHRYEAWRPAGTELVVIYGDSASDYCYQQVAARAPYDWLFIDADHHEQAVRRDWKLYGPLVRAGGLVAFHDVAPSDDQTIEVAPLWLELKTRYQTTEFVEPDGFGIGVVLL